MFMFPCLSLSVTGLTQSHIRSDLHVVSLSGLGYIMGWSQLFAWWVVLLGVCQSQMVTLVSMAGKWTA